MVRCTYPVFACCLLPDTVCFCLARKEWRLRGFIIKVVPFLRTGSVFSSRQLKVTHADGVDRKNGIFRVSFFFFLPSFFCCQRGCISGFSQPVFRAAVLRSSASCVAVLADFVGRLIYIFYGFSSCGKKAASPIDRVGRYLLSAPHSAGVECFSRHIAGVI